MKRRAFLAAGPLGAASLAGCAGLLGVGSSTGGGDLTLAPGPRQGDPLPPDPDGDDGYPPAFDEHPPEQTLGEDNFRPYEVSAGSVINASEDVTVTLASIEATYYWYARREARFVDARGPNAYRAAHVYGAVSSPANARIEGNPVGDWPTGDRVVCYCGCPHHLSSIRAAELQRAGFEEVYVIDDGFGDWLEDRDYPVAGSRVAALPEPWRIRGRTDPADAGGTAWARHPETGQREAGPIDEDGRYDLTLHFYDVSADSRLTVETPSYTVSGALGDLSDGVVRPQSAE